MGNDGKDMEHPADLDLSSSSSFPFPTITSTSASTSIGAPCSSYMYNHQHNPNPRKKRTKLVKINEPNSLLGNNKPPKCNRKPDPLAPKITRPCTECGKKFWSWKALFGHMRCHPERQWRGINPPPNYRRDPPPPPPPHTAAAAATTTSSPSIPHQKDLYFLGATEQVNDMSEEEHEVAACLLMLANSDHNAEGGGSSQIHYDQEATCRFECSSCKKVFGSHQALGGHRASHKNVKGCFAITRTSCDGCQIPAAAAADHVVKDNLEAEEGEGEDHNMMVVWGHKCDICSRVFPSGQALGGHKRCHWEKGEEATSSMLNNNEFRGPSSLLSKQAAVGACGCGGLDLNLPAPIEHEYSASSTLTLDLRLGL